MAQTRKDLRGRVLRKVNHRDVQTGDMYILIQILSEDVNMFMRKTL